MSTINKADHVLRGLQQAAKDWWDEYEREGETPRGICLRSHARVVFTWAELLREHLGMAPLPSWADTRAGGGKAIR